MAFLSEADEHGVKHLFEPMRLHISAIAERIFKVVHWHVQTNLMPAIMSDPDRRIMEWDSDRTVVHQDDLVGANYPLVKEFLLELGSEVASSGDFQAALGLVAVTVFAGADFHVKGGKGRIRSWAQGQAEILKALVAWVVRQEQRSYNSRSDRITVLKKIIQLKRAVQSLAPVAHEVVSDTLAPASSAELELVPHDSMIQETGAEATAQMPEPEMDLSTVSRRAWEFPEESGSDATAQSPEPEVDLSIVSPNAWEFPEDLQNDVQSEEEQSPAAVEDVRLRTPAAECVHGLRSKTPEEDALQSKLRVEVADLEATQTCLEVGGMRKDLGPAFEQVVTPRKPAIRYIRSPMVTPRMLPPFSPPEGETPSTVPFEVAMPEPRSADCYGVDDGYKSPRHMLDTAERDALVDKTSEPMKVEQTSPLNVCPPSSSRPPLIPDRALPNFPTWIQKPGPGLHLPPVPVSLVMEQKVVREEVTQAELCAAQQKLEGKRKSQESRGRGGRGSGGRQQEAKQGRGRASTRGRAGARGRGGTRGRGNTRGRGTRGRGGTQGRGGTRGRGRTRGRGGGGTQGRGGTGGRGFKRDNSNLLTSEGDMPFQGKKPSASETKGKGAAAKKGNRKQTMQGTREVPCTPRKARASRGQFLTQTAKKRRIQLALKNLDILKENAHLLQDFRFPEPSFDRQSYTLDGPTEGKKGAVGGKPCQISVILDKNLFYVGKGARVAPELAEWASVDGKKGATIGWYKSPTIKIAWELAKAVAGWTSPTLVSMRLAHERAASETASVA